MAQLSDDCFAQDGRLMRIDEALALIEARSVALVDAETIPLGDALGRILAADIVAGRSVPPHDNSAVDGYAVHFDDLEADSDTILPIGGRAAAGHPLRRPAGRGEAIRIFTGAPMPEGPDTVMMQEDCSIVGDGAVRIRAGIKRGANRRLAGEDVTAGTVVLKSGRRLRPADLGLVASLGLDRVTAFRPLSVALLSTGDEIRDPGGEAPEGCVFDANRYLLKGLLERLGCRVTDLGILADRRDPITAALAQAARTHDLVLASGGMSVGDEDHVRAAVEALGTLHFWRLAIKPGRPMALGQIGRVPFVGLPGNPVAVAVTFLRIARPLILRLAGGRDPEPVLYRVRAGFEHRKKPERREWVRVHLVADETGAPVAVKFPRQGAGILSSIVQSDGLVELPEAMTYLEPGTMVDFLPFTEVDA